MLVPILLQARWYNIPWWKGVVTAVLLTISGTIGTYLLFFVENHWIGGTSFYGAVFIVPVLFLLIFRLIRVPYGALTDLCAPAECIMLAIMKIQCLLGGCCGGKTICFSSGVQIQFPSQIVELVNALAIFAILFWLSRKKQYRGSLYGWYMVLYGITRFVLNFLRADTSVFAMGLSAGAFWSVWAVLIGAGVLLVWHFRRKQIITE